MLFCNSESADRLDDELILINQIQVSPCSTMNHLCSCCWIRSCCCSCTRTWSSSSSCRPRPSSLLPSRRSPRCCCSSSSSSCCCSSSSYSFLRRHHFPTILRRLQLKMVSLFIVVRKGCVIPPLAARKLQTISPSYFVAMFAIGQGISCVKSPKI